MFNETAAPRMQPRQLFPEEHHDPRAASSETLNIMAAQPVLGARGDGRQDEQVYEEDKGDWSAAVAKADAEAEAAVHRPPKLDLSQSVPLSNLRFSTTSSSETPPTPSSLPPPKDEPKKQTIRPTLGLIFSLSPRATRVTVLLPATLLSVVCGLFPPYMTELVGRAFGAFTTYTMVTANPTLAPEQLSQAQSALMGSVKNAAIQFVVLAGFTFFLSTAMVYLWVINGERAVRTLRMEVFKGIGGRDLAWFDLGMGVKEGAGEGEEGDEKQSGQGAGGLMGRFTK